MILHLLIASAFVTSGVLFHMIISAALHSAPVLFFLLTAVTIIQNQIVNGTFDQASTSIFIATTGSDTTGNGTSGAPYATMAKALSTLPALITQAHTINVADGTYAEPVLLQGFVCAFGGSITITGNTTTPTNVNFTGHTTVTVRNADFDPCVAAVGPVVATVQGIKAGATCTNGIVSLQGAYLVIDRCSSSGTFTSSGVQASIGSIVEFRGNCTISGWTARGIGIFHTSRAYYTSAGTLTITGPGSGTPFGVHIAFTSSFICSTASTNFTITGEVKYGFQLGLQSNFQHTGATSTITVDNVATPANSAGAICTDNSSWSATCTTTFDHLTASFEVNSISYAEATGTRNYTNTGAALASQNGVVFLP